MCLLAEAMAYVHFTAEKAANLQYSHLAVLTGLSSPLTFQHLVHMFFVVSDSILSLEKVGVMVVLMVTMFH